MVSKRLAAAAAMVALSCGSLAFAADAGSSAAADAPVYLQAAPAPSGPTSLTPVMFLLDPSPVGKWMEANKITVTGFAEGGYFYDTSAPKMSKDGPTFVSYPGTGGSGGYSNRGVLDQLDLTVEKTLDATKTWDWGFLFENGYGIDDEQTHSYGILDHRAPGGVFNKGGSGEGIDPDNQYDIVQANVSLLVPIGSGLTITAGKFVSLFSNEIINPTGNQFYTHSYNFYYGVSATNTGVLGSYTFAKAVNGNDLTVTGGITRGWNESTRDNNGAIDFLGEAKTSLTSKLSTTFNVEEGPEGASDDSNYWTSVEDILAYTVSDQLTVSGDFLYSDYPHGASDTPAPAAGVSPGANAQWYGAALYAGYKFNSNFTLNGRVEWYRDQGGFTTGNQANYYEATAGVDIHPLPNDNIFQWLQLRPEVRFDMADRPVYNLSHDSAIGGAGDYDQFTVAMDAIMQF